MTVSNRAYALLGLAEWCRHHGIYEMREVLKQATGMAAAASSGEDLATAMEAAAFAPEKPEPEPVVEQAKPVAKTKAKA